MKNALFASFLLISAAFAGGKPDLTGNWELNLKTSDLAGQPSPGSMRYVCRHADPKLHYDMLYGAPPGESHGSLDYVTDGSEGTVTIMGNAMKYRAVWRDATLVVDTWGKFGDLDVKIHDEWSVSQDGKTLTVERRVEGAGPVRQQKLMFDRF